MGICVGGLLNPVIALLGYMWYSLMRPDALAWQEGMYPYSLVFAIVTLFGSWRYLPNLGRWITNPFVWSLLLLQIPMVLSIQYALDPALAGEAYMKYLRILVVCLMIPLFVQTEKHFRWMMLTMVISLGTLGLKFGLFGLRSGGIVIETGLGGFMSDNNTLAMALVMAFPMIYYARGIVVKHWQKTAMLGAAFTTVVAVIMSHSRAAALTLAVVYLFMAWRSRHKAAMIVMAVVLSLPALYLVRESFTKRMQTLENPEAEGSASVRMEYARAAVKVWKDYPVIGVGFGTENWVKVSPQYLGRVNEQGHVIHNNYLQMAVDSGTGAFMILVLQLFGAIWWLGRSAKRMRKLAPENEAYPRMLQLALVAFSFCSIFASRTDYDFYYYLIMATGSWMIIERKLLPGLRVSADSGASTEQSAPVPGPGRDGTAPRQPGVFAPSPTAGVAVGWAQHPISVGPAAYARTPIPRPSPAAARVRLTGYPLPQRPVPQRLVPQRPDFAPRAARLGQRRETPNWAA